MVIIKDTISGAGHNWAIPAAVERHVWLSEQTHGTFKAWWGATGGSTRDSLFSDDFYISFDNEEDATAYALRWAI